MNPLLMFNLALGGAAFGGFAIVAGLGDDMTGALVAGHLVAAACWWRKGRA